MDQEFSLEETRELCLLQAAESLQRDPPEIPDERVLKVLAQDLWGLGRIAESLACVRLLERLDELTPRELILRGYWQLYVGDGPGALKTFEEIREQDQDDPAARLGYAFALFYQGDYRAAASVFQKLADEETMFKSPPVMAAASRALANGERPDEIQMAPLPALPPGMAEIMQMRIIYGLEVAIGEAEKILAGLPSGEDRLGVERLLVELQLEAGRELQAIGRIEELLKSYPEDGPLLYFKGIATRRLDRRDESHEAFLEAVLFAPLEARAWGGLGAGCLERQRFDQAARAYRVAVFLDKSNPHFWGDLGLCQSCEGRWREAIESFSEAIDLGARTFDNYLNRGVCYQELGEYSSADQDFHRALAVNPNHHRAEELRQSLYRSDDDSESDDRFVFGDVP
jgi:tetratricopeptide (TPR) repeat protein